MSVNKGRFDQQVLIEAAFCVIKNAIFWGDE
jgi:hypothetical protein